MSASSTTSLANIEAGITTTDDTILVASVGTAVCCCFANRILPDGKVKKTIIRNSNWMKMVTEAAKNKHPKTAVCISLMFATFTISLYWSDVLTDYLLAYEYYDKNLFGYFYLTIAFIGIPHALAMFGIARYSWKEWKQICYDFRFAERKEKWKPITMLTKYRWKRRFLAVAIIFFLPILPICFDVLMPFYRIFHKCLPNTLINFMVQYEATRTLSESLVESLPQTILQLLIFFVYNDGELENETSYALLRSVILSGVSITYHLINAFYEMKKEGLTFCNYVQSLVEMGAGIPLRALHNNEKFENDTFKLSFPLLDLQVKSLVKAFEVNTSVNKLDLRNTSITDRGGVYIGEILKKNSKLTILHLKNNNIGDEGCKSIFEGLRINRTLTRLKLRKNNIGDDGGKSIGEALKVNPTLAELNLQENNFSDDMKSHLQWVQKCKQEGSNGYSQVTGMRIRTS
jgi:hypothetical protein